MRALIFDALAFIGLGLVTYGLACVYAPLAWIVPGVALGGVGLFGAYVFEQRDRARRKLER